MTMTTKQRLGSTIAAAAPLAAALMTLATAGPVPAHAAKAKAKATAPAAAPAAAKGRPVDRILADYESAIGGTKAWDGVKSIRLLVRVEIKGMGITGEGERIQTADDRFYEGLTIPGIGLLERGSDGKRHWAKDPINGLRLLEGVEKEQSHIDTAWLADLRWKSLYREVRAVATAQPGLDCLEFVTASGAPTTRCFDAKTSLVVTQSGTQASPQGETPYKASFADYRDVGGGGLMPHRHDLTAGPVTMSMTVTKVERNVPVKNARFQLPKP